MNSICEFNLRDQINTSPILVHFVPFFFSKDSPCTGIVEIRLMVSDTLFSCSCRYSKICLSIITEFDPMQSPRTMPGGISRTGVGAARLNKNII